MNFYINLFFVAIIFHLVNENNAIVHKLIEHNDFIQMIQYQDGNAKGESETFHIPPKISHHSMSESDLENSNLKKLSKLISKKCALEYGSGIMGDIDPSYFQNDEFHNDLAYYVGKFKEKMEELELDEVIKKVKVYPSGIFVIKFTHDATESQIFDILKILWSKSLKVWVMELDTTTTLIKTVKEDHSFSQDEGTTTYGISKPNDDAFKYCPIREFLGPHDYPVPNDKFFPLQWGLSNRHGYDIDALKYWAIDKPEPTETVIAVLDSGLNFEMDDFDDKKWINHGEIPNNGIDDDKNGYVDDYYGWDFGYESNKIIDHDEHGTLCSGVAAAATNDGYGIASITNSSVKLSALAHIYVSDAVESIYYSIDKGFKVMSASWGVDDADIKTLKKALIDVGKAGLLFVNSVTNSRADLTVNKKYPNWYNFDWTINVGSVNYHGYVSVFSDYGAPYTHVYAPGECILTTNKGSGCDSDYYEFSHGCSFAAPLVAAIAADIWSYFPNLTNLQIKEAILKSCVSNGKFTTDHAVCGGIVNAYNAYQIAKAISEGSSY